MLKYSTFSRSLFMVFAGGQLESLFGASVQRLLHQHVPGFSQAIFFLPYLKLPRYGEELGEHGKILSDKHKLRHFYDEFHRNAAGQTTFPSSKPPNLQTSFDGFHKLFLY